MYTAAGWAPGLGVHRSLNGGATWDTLLAITADDIAIDPQDASKVYVAYRQIYRSMDGGDTWEIIGSEAGLTEHVRVVAVNPVNPAIVYAGGGNSMFRSTDHGSTWSSFDDGLPEPHYEVKSIAVDGENGETILVGTASPEGIFRRTESLAAVGASQDSADIRFSACLVSPNPSTGQIRVSYRLLGPSRVAVEVYDIAGRPTRTLAHEPVSAGVHYVSWDGRDSEGRPVAPGIYLIRIKAAGEEMTRKAVLLQ
jgi:hypothetical protein